MDEASEYHAMLQTMQTVEEAGCLEVTTEVTSTTTATMIMYMCRAYLNTTGYDVLDTCVCVAFKSCRREMNDIPKLRACDGCHEHITTPALSQCMSPTVTVRFRQQERTFRHHACRMLRVFVHHHEINKYVRILFDACPLLIYIQHTLFTLEYFR